MQKQNHHVLHQFLLLSFLLALPYAAAQDNFFGNSGEKFAPSTIIIIIMAVIFAMTAFLALILRQFSEGCFGLNIAPPNPNVTVDGQLAARGLDADVIKTIPTYFYSDVKAHRKGKVELECPVCLSEFLDAEALRLLPGCSHVFHPRCIDRWLMTHVTCPICRQNLDPGSGPSKEHVVNVPLTQADDQSDGSDHPMQSEDHEDGDDVETGEPTRRSTSNNNIVGKFPRSHSTGHSMQLGNSERFTLRLPDEVHNTLVNRSSYGGRALTSILSPRRGYKWGWFSNTTTPVANNPRSGLVRSLVSPVGGGGSLKKSSPLPPVKTSECLWPI